MVHPGVFVIWIALGSTILAFLAIFLAWLVYRPARYEEFMATPAARRPDDPLRRIIGPVFEALKNKWWIDELYQAVILNPYIQLCRFLAEVVDWRFWHDWFHDQVITRGYNLFTKLLAVRIDLGVIDAIANGLGEVAKRVGASLRRVQTGYARNYALSIFLGVVIILGYLILR
jgi:NADH-quinone oxidoreductase subunit L